MDLKNYNHFHTGYYLFGIELYEKMWKRLSLETNDDYVCEDEDDSDNKNHYVDASIFLQGSCELFSLALHQKFGYPAYKIQYESHIHYFCVFTYNETKVYIDVRGATTDFHEFVSSTMLPSLDFSCYEFTPQDIEETAKLTDPYAREGLAFAKKIIDTFPLYYNIETS